MNRPVVGWTLTLLNFLPDKIRAVGRFWAPAGLLELYRSWRAPLRPDPSFSLRVVTLEDLFPGIEQIEIDLEVRAVLETDEWALPLYELACIAAICRFLSVREAFEIGTFTGRTTAVIAANAASDAVIHTLDLSPEARKSHRHGRGVGIREFDVGGMFRDSRRAARIRQHFGDSRSLDYAPFAGRMDFVFIDGDHSDEFVRADSLAALSLVRPGGIVIWDDYRWTEAHPECAGVTRVLNDLARDREILALSNSRLAFHKAPGTVHAGRGHS